MEDAVEGLEATEENAFEQDVAQGIIKDVVDSTLGSAAYQHNKVSQWTSDVIEGCLTRLKKMEKPFKYIVTSVIMQKNGAGLHVATSCFWDNNTDGSATMRWENKSMCCITTIFGLAL